MNEPFTFYRALDPVKGSWDGYGFIPFGASDFLAFVTDAPSAASVHTPELIQEFWKGFCRENTNAGSDLWKIELADGINRLHDSLRKRSRSDGSAYQGTLCIARKNGDQLIYCSIGDSVLQLFRDGKLYRLNDSEIWDGSLVVREDSKLSERQRTRSLRFVGDSGDFLEASQIVTLQIRQGDRLLMNTDGMEDLLSPDRLIPLLKMPADEMRRRFETVFAQDRLKDDVTFLMLPMEVRPPFHAEKEVAAIRYDLEHLQKENTHLQQMEDTLRQLAQNVQLLSKRLEASGTPGSAPVYFSQDRRPTRSSRLLAAATFLFGLLVASGLFLLGRPERIERSAPATIPKTRRVSPPEIPASQTCNYIVIKGDTLETIAAAQKITTETLLRMNPGLKKTSSLQVGQKIVVCEATP